MSKQPHNTARAHCVQGPGEKPGGKCQTKAGPSSQQVCQAAEEKSADALSRKVTKNSEQETGQQKASAHVCLGQEYNEQVMHEV